MSGKDLEEIRTWADLRKDLIESERNYLEASKLSQLRSKQRKIMGIVVVISGILLGLSLIHI